MPLAGCGHQDTASSGGRFRSVVEPSQFVHAQDFDAKQLQVFKREVEVLSQIYHPNVCLFMGACFEKGHMMIVSELVPKGDLDKVCCLVVPVSLYVVFLTSV